MNTLISIFAASVLVLSSASVLAADPPKNTSTMKAPAAKLEKPADVTAEAWTKMTDAEKQKAIDAAKAKTKAPATKEAAPKKEKKGGC